VSQAQARSQVRSTGSLEWVVPTRSSAVRPPRAYRRGRPSARRASRLLRHLTVAEAMSAGVLIASLVAYAIQQAP